MMNTNKQQLQQQPQATSNSRGSGFQNLNGTLAQQKLPNVMRMNQQQQHQLAVNGMSQRVVPPINILSTAITANNNHSHIANSQQIFSTNSATQNGIHIFNQPLSSATNTIGNRGGLTHKIQALQGIGASGSPVKRDKKSQNRGGDTQNLQKQKSNCNSPTKVSRLVQNHSPSKNYGPTISQNQGLNQQFNQSPFQMQQVAVSHTNFHLPLIRTSTNLCNVNGTSPQKVQHPQQIQSLINQQQSPVKKQQLKHSNSGDNSNLSTLASPEKSPIKKQNMLSSSNDNFTQMRQSQELQFQNRVLLSNIQQTDYVNMGQQQYKDEENENFTTQMQTLTNYDDNLVISLSQIRSGQISTTLQNKPENTQYRIKSKSKSKSRGNSKYSSPMKKSKLVNQQQPSQIPQMQQIAIQNQIILSSDESCEGLDQKYTQSLENLKEENININLESDNFIQNEYYNMGIIEANQKREQAFNQQEVEYDAKFTESAYFSEQKPGPNAPNQSNSYVHSLIQSHVDNNQKPNQMSQPIFSYIQNNQNNPTDKDDYFNIIVEELDNSVEQQQNIRQATIRPNYINHQILSDGFEETVAYQPVETAEVIESDRGHYRENIGTASYIYSDIMHETPAIKHIHDSNFEIQHSTKNSNKNISSNQHLNIQSDGGINFTGIVQRLVEEEKQHQIGNTRNLTRNNQLQIDEELKEQSTVQSAANVPPEDDDCIDSDCNSSNIEEHKDLRIDNKINPTSPSHSPNKRQIQESDTNRRQNIKNYCEGQDTQFTNQELQEQLLRQSQNGQKFSNRARQVMEEKYGQVKTVTTENLPTFSKDMIEIRMFKKSAYYKAIEQAALLGEDLIIRDASNGKFDLDSDEGQTICKNYLSSLERFFLILQMKTQSRQYREKFSKAYKVLYNEDNLCYLTEILDSAQEGFPYLWVNGEKYVFSKDVLDSGQALFQHFCKIKNYINSFNKRVSNDEIKEIKDLQVKKQKLEEMLEQLDLKWTHYEQCYVFELMVIETDARRFIVDAIQMESEISEYEQKEKKKGVIFLQNSSDYNSMREKFIGKVCEINSVANVSGKGRDDFKIDVLLKAEDLTRKISPNQSSAVRKLSDNIKQTLHTFRVLLKKYNENVEVVDPQLKNNQELVEVLNDWEKAWALGKEHLLDQQKCEQLIEFSQIIECTADKHKPFQEQIECREAEIFMSIPCLLILKSLDTQNNFDNQQQETVVASLDKNICKRFLPKMFKEGEETYKKYNELIEEFEKLKIKHNQLSSKNSNILQQTSHRRSSSYEFFNELEKYVLRISSSEEISNSKELVSSPNIELSKLPEYQKIQQYISNLGMELQRHNPTEWNEFMTACLGGN